MTPTADPRKNRDDDIAACLISLVEMPPSQKAERARIYDELGSLYDGIGKLNESIGAYLKALELDPSNGSYWAHFSEAIKYAEFSRPNDSIKAIILTCYSKPQVDPQSLAVPALSLLKLSPHYGSVDAAILNDPLLLELLNRTIVPDAGFEAWMTNVRRGILLQEVEAPQQFVRALRHQCALNEYIYRITASEEKVIQESFSNRQTLTNEENNILACYRPDVRRSEEKLEADIIARIPTLAPITDSISMLVQAQYEESPYPRWTTVPRIEPKPLKEIIHKLFPLQPTDIGSVSSPDILIAGCGTGQQAVKAALNYANSRVLAVDLSLRSLAYASRKAAEIEVGNIEFMQGDILDFGRLGRQFDVIECSGVLHHMHDPMKGWKALVPLLKPQGVMAVSLYSEIARQDVVAARALIRKLNLEPTLEGIRECRHRLLEDPAFDLLTRSVDFYTASACRDLLFHVQEHRFTLPQIAEALDILKLKLIGLEVRDHAAMVQYAAMFPDDPGATSLHNWHIFEQKHPHTFMGMYHLWLQIKNSD